MTSSINEHILDVLLRLNTHVCIMCVGACVCCNWWYTIVVIVCQAKLKLSVVGISLRKQDRTLCERCILLMF